MILKELHDKNLINPPSFLLTNTTYLCVMGSICYGVETDSSDFDVYGFAIPPKSDIFPYTEKLYGFDEINVFEQWQKHHILDQSALGGKGREYDFSVFNIVKYVKLCMDSNPNMLDSLFVPQNCILHSTAVSELLRDNRKLFLSKSIWAKYKGYSYSQLHKASGKNPEAGSKRKALRDAYGMDTKFLYHVIRLLSEAEQILLEGDLDLQEKGRREHMKAIRRGEVSEKDIREWASNKEKQLEDLYHKSTLPLKPNKEAIKEVLLKCLEQHYGSLEKYIQQPNWSIETLRKMDSIIENCRNQLYL